jgi:hypothetical protein
MHATWPDHLIFLDLIILILFAEECKLWSSSVCSFLNSVTSPYLSPNILFSTDSQIHSVAWENNLSCHTVQKCMMLAFKRLFFIQIVTVILVGLWSSWMWYCVVRLILQMRCVVVSLTWPIWGPTDYFPFQCLFTSSLFSLTLSPHFLSLIFIFFPVRKQSFSGH